MKQRDAIQFLQKRYHNLNRHYPDVLEEFDMEAIHQFRLEVKKLRAFLRLLNACGKQEKGLQIGKKLRDFYHAAGNVRCLQLQKEMVRQWCQQFNYPEPVAYLAHLHLKEEEAKVDVREKSRFFSLEKEASLVLKTASHGLDLKMEEAFVDGKKAAMLQCLSGVNLGDETLHAIRKALKDLLYMWHWVAPFIEETFGSENLTRQSCIKLTDRLGDFQDLCISLTFLTTEHVGGVQNPYERAVLERLHTYCVGRKAELRKEIVFLLQPLQGSLQASGVPAALASYSSVQILNNSI